MQLLIPSNLKRVLTKDYRLIVVGLISIAVFMSLSWNAIYGRTVLSTTDTGSLFLLKYAMTNNTGYQYEVFSFDHDLGKIGRQFPSGQGPSATLSEDGNTLYIFSFDDSSSNSPALSAFDTNSGSLLWHIPVPELEFAFTNALPIERIWSASDGSPILYVMARMYGIAQVLTIDIEQQHIIGLSPIPLPYSTIEYPVLFWKLPWKDTLVVAQKDQVFPFELSGNGYSDETLSGSAGETHQVGTHLSNYGSIVAGEIDSQTQQLLLATATQDLIAIDPEDFSVTELVKLPIDYEFFKLKPISIDVGGEGGTLNVLVRKIVYSQYQNAFSADELWIYNLADWSKRGQWDLRTLLSEEAPDIEFSSLLYTDLASSKEVSGTFIATSHGLLHARTTAGGELFVNWSPLNKGPDTQWARYGLAK